MNPEYVTLSLPYSFRKFNVEMFPTRISMFDKKISPTSLQYFVKYELIIPKELVKAIFKLNNVMANERKAYICNFRVNFKANGDVDGLKINVVLYDPVCERVKDLIIEEDVLRLAEVKTDDK